MRVLLVKTSSLGDLIHTFPALTDASKALPGIRFNWLVEEAFAEVPGWHPAVDEVITVSLRRWRKAWAKAFKSSELTEFRKVLKRRRYDLILDAQGLFKSAAFAWLADGPRAGLDRRSARESLASFFYHRRYAVARGQHAITRTRQLFAQALGYALPDGDVDYGLHFSTARDAGRMRLVLLHGTTWPSKHWPEPYWAELAHLAHADGFEVGLPWGDPDDRLRAERIIKAAGCGELLPRQGLTELAAQLARADGVVGVDSGLAHLAAAVGTPAITLYGPTRTELTGALGPHQRNLAAEFACAPCMQRECTYKEPSPVAPACFAGLDPRQVYTALQAQIAGAAA